MSRTALAVFLTAFLATPESRRWPPMTTTTLYWWWG